ncbi:AMP-binding protein [Facilibium subflavum]|uniref:AMP-binding protein n=1 Tax=Facilibium subflavum TaxID=2219058 RepID=UPI000E65ABCF|nr:AMP-binding protein [Facilibium subflavum]
MLTSDQSLHESFFTQANKTPNATALVDGDTALSYRQLQNAILSLAARLEQKGISTDTVVGLYCDKRFELIVAFLAISTLGGQCVQLDKAFPDALLQDIIQQTNTAILLCDCSMDDKTVSATIFNLVDLCQQCIKTPIDEIVMPTVNPEKILWLVYSSGTTGTHKGIAISHKAILSSYQTRNQVKPYDHTSRVGCNIYYFWEVFRPLLCGGITYIINDDILHDFEKLADTIEKQQINEFLFTPSYLETLLHYAPIAAEKIFQQLKVCWLNGEVVSSALYHQLRPYIFDTNIYNLYSISECHDVAVFLLTDEKQIDHEGIIPAGFLLDGVKAILLDSNQKPCKAGEKGELYIHSPGLANGYINREDLNKERFIEASQSPIGKRLYKTGDYARLDNDKHLITVYGRCDYLVKLRGYTISLPFVEAVIKDKLNVMHCVVNKMGDNLLNEHLVAYLEIPENEQNLFRRKWQLYDATSKKITDILGAFLAPYMQPHQFILIHQIKINAYSNKLDRHSIKPLVKEKNVLLPSKINNTQDYRQLWASLLNIDMNMITDEDCFFKLGGSSLLAMRLLAITAQMGLNKLTIRQFLQASNFLASFQQFTQSCNMPAHQFLYKEILDDIDQAFETLKFAYHSQSAINASCDKKTKHWLLTGATGFLGSQLLKQLLIQSNDLVTCFIRAHSAEHAWKRLYDVAEKCNIDPQIIPQRVDIMIGDLADNKLGLTDTQWQVSSMIIDGVIHAAANVNLILPYAKVKSSCFGSVASLIQFCLHGKKKRLFHISTNGILPKQVPIPHPENYTDNQTLKQLSCGYAQAKWAAEKLIQKASSLGLDSTIFRPGNLGPATKEYLNLQDMNYLILQGIEKAKSVPENLFIEITPVDHIATFIISIAQSQSNSAIYNMTNKYLIDAKTIAKYWQLPKVSPQTWRKTLDIPALNCLLEDDPHCLDAPIHHTYHQENYERMLCYFNMSYPRLTPDYLANLIYKPTDKKDNLCR